jgi:hypothetical protein
MPVFRVPQSKNEFLNNLPGNRVQEIFSEEKKSE